MGEILYSFAVETPQYLERARRQVVTMTAYRDGSVAAITQSGSTYSLYDASNIAIVSAAAVTVTAGVAAYTITAGTLPATLELEDGWREEWSLVMPDGTTRLVRRDAGLCLHLLYPVVSFQSLEARHPGIEEILPPQDPRGQKAIDDAWVTINNRIVSQGRRPYLVLNPWATKEAHTALTLSRVYRHAASSVGDGERRRYATEYQDEYKQAWADIQFKYDDDQDGIEDGGDLVGAESVIALNMPPRWRG